METEQLMLQLKHKLVIIVEVDITVLEEQQDKHVEQVNIQLQHKQNLLAIV